MTSSVAIRTLIVDDEPVARQVLREELRGFPDVDLVGALDQRRWSMTANRLKHDIEKGRQMVLGLGIAGAILSALAAHLHIPIQVADSVRFNIPYPAASEYAGYAGAAALALAVVVRAQNLGRERLQAWILARAASESFKREMYNYRTSSGAYSNDHGGNPDITLFDRRDDILGKITSLQKYAVEPVPRDVVPLGPLDANAYISERVTGPISWFRSRADRYSAAQGTLQNLEYLLSIVRALLGAALTFSHNQAYGAWVAVITTISGSVGAHVLAERYDQLTVSYRATADRLTGILGRWRASPGTVGQLVEQVEAALLEENQAWIAGADDLLKDAVSPPAKNSPQGPSQPSPAA